MQHPTRLVRVASLVILSLAAASAARSQTVEQQLEQPGHATPTTHAWDITLGAGIAASPNYLGGSHYRAEAIPFASVSYDRTVFLGPSGLGINLVNVNGFHAGPVIGIGGSRDQDDDAHLHGLGNIQTSLTAGLFAAYSFGPFEVSGTARQAITHSSNGFIGLLAFDYRTFLIPSKLDLAIGPDVEFADTQYARAWFGVTVSQSTLSDLPVFTPGGGVRDYGAHAALTYHYSAHVLVRGFATFKELTGDFASSPIVESRSQTIMGVGAGYHF